MTESVRSTEEGTPTMATTKPATTKPAKPATGETSENGNGDTAAPRIDLAALAGGLTVHEVKEEEFGKTASKPGKKSTPSPFQPHIKTSWNDGKPKPLGFDVPAEQEKIVVAALRLAARQLELGVKFDNIKSEDGKTVTIQFKARKQEIKRRSDEEKLKVVEWAKANGRAVQVADVKILPDGKVEGSIHSNVYAAYDRAMKAAATAE